jgi:hypothetical protein
LIRFHAELFDDDVLYPLVNWFISHNLSVFYAFEFENRQVSILKT